MFGGHLTCSQKMAIVGIFAGICSPRSMLSISYPQFVLYFHVLLLTPSLTVTYSCPLRLLWQWHDRKQYRVNQFQVQWRQTKIFKFRLQSVWRRMHLGTERLDSASLLACQVDRTTMSRCIHNYFSSLCHSKPSWKPNSNEIAFAVLALGQWIDFY